MFEMLKIDVGWLGSPPRVPDIDTECAVARDVRSAIKEVLGERINGDDDDGEELTTSTPVKVNVKHKSRYGSNGYGQKMWYETDKVGMQEYNITLYPGGPAAKLTFFQTKAQSNHWKFHGAEVAPRYMYIWIEKNGTLRATMAHLYQSSAQYSHAG